MHVAGSQMSKSYLRGGTIRGVQFENLTVGGICVEDGGRIDLRTAGEVSNVTYTCPRAAVNSRRARSRDSATWAWLMRPRHSFEHGPASRTATPCRRHLARRSGTPSSSPT